MAGPRGVTVCVNYDDILSLTLRRNMRYLSKCVVVTSYEDARVAAIVRDIEGAQLFRTDAFTRNGAIFNKALALEEAFDVLGRSGWILSFDADVVFSVMPELELLDKNMLYGMWRRQLPDGVLDFEGDWTRWELMNDLPCMGFFQLFHAEATALKSQPWFPIGSAYAGSHAGSADGAFIKKFMLRCQLPHSVLHIGQPFENWYGRATSRLDGVPVPDADRNRLWMGEFLLSKSWPFTRPDLQELAREAWKRPDRGKECQG